MVWENHMSSDREWGDAPFHSITVTGVIQNVTLRGHPCMCDSEVASAKPSAPLHYAPKGHIRGPDEPEAI